MVTAIPIPLRGLALIKNHSHVHPLVMGSFEGTGGRCGGGGTDQDQDELPDVADGGAAGGNRSSGIARLTRGLAGRAKRGPSSSLWNAPSAH